MLEFRCGRMSRRFGALHLGRRGLCVVDYYLPMPLVVSGAGALCRGRGRKEGADLLVVWPPSPGRRPVVAVRRR